MGHSLAELIRRARNKVVSLDNNLVRLENVISDAQAARAVCARERKETIVQIDEWIVRLQAREADGLKRSRGSIETLSTDPLLRFRQALNRVCDEADIQRPDWIKSFSESDFRQSDVDGLLDRLVRSDGGIAPMLNLEQREALAERVAELVSGLKPRWLKSEILFAKAPDWAPEAAHELATHFRSEMGIRAPRGVQVSDRALIASTAWSRTFEQGEWLVDVALRLMARVRPFEPLKEPQDGKAGAAVEVYIRTALKKGSPQKDNLRLLEDALAVFSAPGAMARAYRFGLADHDREFCYAWFAANKDFAAALGARTGSAAAFDHLVTDSKEFRAKYFGAAPNSVAEERNLAGKDDFGDFASERPETLIKEARHALVDTTLHSSLVTMPKLRSRFLTLGSSVVLHKGPIDVSELWTKAFLSEARDAAEVEDMQGTNPMAITAGLATWISEDGKRREAPVFVALADFDEESKTVTRKAPFILNRSLFRRIEVDYPAVDKKASIFDALSGISFGADLEAVFARVVAAVAARTPSASPIEKIEDVCLVGSFDSSRAVFERRLDLNVFPTLIDNPVVRLLAEGSAQELMLGPDTPFGGRSPPDEVQRLAVRAAVGGTSFVLEGPPGTGKTQTIVAMLDALNKAGKKVLVSAAMPGAIEVIGRRMTPGVAFSISSMRDKEIDVGMETKKVDFKNAIGNVFVGTPMALIKDIPSDAVFDVLIIDEGSQVRLSHALALAGHVKQIIIAGDSRQLQPHESKNNSVSELSLLKRARQARFPVVMLENHYRSRHPSLIAWSNMFSYGGKLKPRRGPWFLGDAGFDVNYVSTGIRQSHKDAGLVVEEAEAIGDEVVRWAKDGQRSVGVVALSQGQRDLIRQVVDRKLSEAGISLRDRHAEEKALESAQGARRSVGFFSSKEPFFIRTAGAVQGEERDVILISLGVARGADGKLQQYTGALGSRPDSVALVNVMLSRARMRTAVYSSVFPWEINPVKMTAGMFLVASILRMGTVVSAPDTADLEIHENFQSDEWSVDRFDVAGGDVYAIRHSEFVDRYALAVAFQERREVTPTIQALSQMGWNLVLRSKDDCFRIKDFVRRGIRSELVDLLRAKTASV